MSVFTGFRRLHNDQDGVLRIITVFQVSERCRRVGSGGGESVPVPESLELWPRVRNGGAESGTVAESLKRWWRTIGTVSDPGILPETLRHRSRVDNGKVFAAVFNTTSDNPAAARPTSCQDRISLSWIPRYLIRPSGLFD